MARLPQPGGDSGNWGTILNEYLAQAHKSDGSIKDGVVTASALAPDSVNTVSIADNSITEVLLEDSVKTKLNAPASIVDGSITSQKLESSLQTKLSNVSSNANRDYASFERVNLGILPGVAGDGVTDNTAAFQAAIDAVGSSSPSVNFYLPAGVWLTDGLKLKSNMAIEGVGGGSFGLDSYTNTRVSVLKLKPNASRSLICDYDSGALVSGVSISNIQLDGNRSNQTSTRHAVELFDAASGQDPMWRIDRVFIRNANGDGIKIGTFRRAIKVTNSEIMDCTGNGISISATDCTIDGVLLGRCGGQGIDITAGLQHISGCDVFGHTENGIRIASDVANVMIQNCGIDLNMKNGILCAGPRNSIVGCAFQTNGQQTDNTYSHINFDFPTLTAVYCTVSSTSFRHDNTRPNKAKYGISTNIFTNVAAIMFNPSDTPWRSGFSETGRNLSLALRSQSFADGVVLFMGTPGNAGVTLGATATEKMGFWGSTPVVRPTGTPAAATDLASTQALANDLRNKLISMGLIS